MLGRLTVFATALAAVPLASAWVISQNVLHPKVRIEDTRLEDVDLPAEEVEFPGRDGTRLAGWFTPAPGGALRAPTVVLSHGWARSRAELLPHANFLHHAGYATLAFDYRHRGKSGGDAVTLGVGERFDLQGALDFVSARPEVDPDRIGLLGMSTGSVIAIVVGARDPRVRAVVAECPYGSYEAIMTRSLHHYYKLPSFPIGPIAKWVIELRLGSTLNDVMARDFIAGFSPRPIFVIADEKDAVIGADETERLYEAAREPRRLWLIRGADHARGWQAGREEYERRVLGFLAEALAADAAPLRAREAASGGA